MCGFSIIMFWSCVTQSNSANKSIQNVQTKPINNHPCTADCISTHSLSGSVKWQELDWTLYELTCHIIWNTLLSVKCQLSTIQSVSFVIRLPWHFPDGDWKMSETKGWLNGFHPLPCLWCFLINRLIPRRNRMCQGRRLMEQTESCIPQTLYLRLNSPAYKLQLCPAPTVSLSLSFALHHLPPWGWVERSNPHQICLYDVLKTQHYSLPPTIRERKR